MGLSYSQLSLAQTCMRKFWHQQVVKTPLGDSQPSGDMAFGSALHTALQSQIEGETLESSIGLFDAFWDAVKDKKYAFGRHKWDYLQDMGPMFLRKFHKSHLEHIKAYSVEVRLYGQLYGYDVEGTPDVLGTYKGIPSVIDFKTSSRNYEPEAGIIGEQMMLYAHLAKEALNYDVHQLVYIVFNKATESIQTPIVTNITPDLLQDRLQNIYAQILKVSEEPKLEAFPQSTGECYKWGRRCEYFQQCFGKFLPQPTL